MTRTSQSAQPPKQAVADVCVLDFGDTWDRWTTIAEPPTDHPIRVRTVRDTIPPSSAFLLITVPAMGLSSVQRHFVQLGISRSRDYVFVASVAPDQLEDGDRERAGYVVLCEEIKKDFKANLIAIPQDSPQEALLVRRVMNAAYRKAHVIGLTEQNDADLELLASESAAAIDYSPTRLDSLGGALFELLEVQRAEALADFAGRCWQTEAQALSWRRQADRELQKDLAYESSDACHRTKIRRPLMYGDFAERIVREISDIAEHIQRILISGGWKGCVVPELENWRSDASQSFSTPAIKLPVVGRFSSGKTTLLNHVLGRTPQGHHLLRTAWTHNTALLARFHSCERDRQRVEFSYRQRLVRELLWQVGMPSERAVFSPCDGKVSNISKAPDETITIILTRNDDGTTLSVRVDPPQRLRSGIKAGSTVREGDELSDGASIQELQAEATRRGDVWVTVKGGVIDQILILIKEQKLSGVRFETSLRVPAHGGYEVLEKMFTDRDSEWIEWLASVTKTEGPDGPEYLEGSHRLMEVGGRFHPLEIYVSAEVNIAKCVKQNPLMTDDDWNWFQGAPTEEQSKKQSRAHSRGFAESPDAELIVDQADIYLNGPLFQLLNIVDTPGLNSTSLRHSIKTEQFIQQGNAFLVVLPLNSAGSDHATETLFEMINTSLRAMHKGGRLGVLPKASDHVFILLNRFQKYSNDRNWRTQMDTLLNRARAAFHPCPKIYLADLRAQASREGLEEELLGYPSLATLFGDLRRYVAKHGIERKFEEAANTLEHAWQFASSRLDREGMDIEGRSTTKTLTELAQARADLAKAVSRSAAMAESRIAKLTEAAEAVKALLHDMTSKEGFVETRRESTRLQDFNNQRDRLKQIVAYQRQELALAVKSVVTPPVIKDAGLAIELLPVLSESSFSSALDEVIKSWPGLFRGMGRWIDRVLDRGEPVLHATVERRRIEELFISCLQGGLDATVRGLRKELSANLSTAESQARQDIGDRERLLRATEENLKPAREKHKAKVAELIHFKDKYEGMKALLHGYKVRMQEIAREE